MNKESSSVGFYMSCITDCPYLSKNHLVQRRIKQTIQEKTRIIRTAKTLNRWVGIRSSDQNMDLSLGELTIHL